MEILSVATPMRKRDCTLAYCDLSTAFDAMGTRVVLDNVPRGVSVLKDTFILPAGGAVATRIHTENPALWFAHCHLEAHRDDGMAFILNVGNYTYQAPSNRSWLPADYPSCDTPFLKTKHRQPACQCYINKDAVLDGALTENHRCSRAHLCAHKQSQAANLDSYKDSGVRISSDYKVANYSIMAIVIGIIVAATLAITVVLPRFRKAERQSEPELNEKGVIGSRSVSSASAPSSWEKIKVQISIDWKECRPGCVNSLRVCEVTGLAALTGLLFYDVGNDPTANGLAQKSSLLFFSVTLWTFTRMYPAVGNFNSWYSKQRENEHETKIGTIALRCMSKCIVTLGCEGKIML